MNSQFKRITKSNMSGPMQVLYAFKAEAFPPVTYLLPVASAKLLSHGGKERQ